MKTIYLVRHGQSEANSKDVLVGKDGPLSELGQAQALIVSERFEHLTIDRLYASDFLRAQQTARPISKLKNLSITVEPVFGEFLEPSEFFGLAEDDEHVLTYRAERNAKVESEPGWTHGDGESIAGFMDRISQARTLLENTDVNTVAVVAHAYFITSFISAILLDTSTPSHEWFTVLAKLKLTNTGISVLQFNDGKWRVLTFNDRAHFAE
jgi:probable phosphoglycerate mutase